jgi:hypothetical protein
LRGNKGDRSRGPQRTPVSRVLGWRRISLARNIKTVSFRGAQHASSHRGHTMSACYHVAQPLLAVHSDRSIFARGICFFVFVPAAFKAARAGFVSQVVPAARGARAPSFRNDDAGRPEAFPQPRPHQPVILSGAFRRMPFTEIELLRFLVGTRSEESLLVTHSGSLLGWF